MIADSPTFIGNFKSVFDNDPTRYFPDILNTAVRKNPGDDPS